jgi:thiopurine S-methyltransferase
MEKEFWLERWSRGETPFHQAHVNPYLGYYYGVVGPPLDKRAHYRVFVPLCGKSRDLWWLQQSGYDVIGVEYSEVAVKQFFTEQQLDHSRVRNERFISYRAKRLEIIQADFFELQEDDIGNISDIFDRASLIAYPEEMRRNYVRKITALQKPGTRTLLITLTYPENEMSGPPFSVNQDEVRRLYNDNFRIEKLASKNILKDEPRFKQRGLTSLTETAYKLTKT